MSFSGQRSSLGDAAGAASGTMAMLALMMDAYSSSASIGSACEDLEASDDGPRDLRDGEAMASFFECMGSAIAGELPPPDEYINRYDVDFWISDDGLVMRERMAMEFAFLPLAAAFTSSDGFPVSMTMQFDLYDLNADFEISPPESE